MFKRSLSWFILVFTLLEFVAKTHLTTYDSTHGFINNNHDRYLAKEISSIQDELSSDIRGVMLNGKHTNSKVQVKFNPEVLDFKCRHLGVPHLEKVTLFNVDSNYSVDMTSISGSTVHFHSSFFENKRIPPLGNTTFNVVFLGREEGRVESNLFIHTTQGHFKYHVKGDSVFSPYRLQPIVGVKIPLNVTFSPYIYFHNPFPRAIQIVEIYCSGGAFHLELPGGEMEGPKDMWEVAPHETKAIIRVRFVGAAEQNHTSYVRIKLNQPHEPETLVVPLEIEASSSALLYTPQGYIDFGIGGSLDAARRVNLTLCNPFPKWIRIASISSSSKSVVIEQLGKLKIPPAQDHQPQCIELAQLILHWRKAHETKRFSGRLTIRYKNHKISTEIPYYLTVVEGGLKFNASQTTFFAGGKPDRLESHKIGVHNAYTQAVKLLGITLSEEAAHYFQATQFSQQVLKPGEERTLFALKLRPGAAWTQMKLDSWFHVRTNISDIKWPLICYDGRLDLQLSHNSKDNSLDLGMISVESKKLAYIMLMNNNPVIIRIKQVQTSIPLGEVEVAGCGRERVEVTLLQDSHNLTKCTEVQQHEYAIVKLSVRSGRSETQIWGDISVNTQFEQISIPVHFRIAAGKLEIGPDRLVFDQCFPGKICSHPLRIHSTFDHPMVIEKIMSIPPDERISCQHNGHILGRAAKVVGTLYLDPAARCRRNCYLGLQDADAEELWWQSLVLPPATADIDLNLVNVLYHRYLNETAHGRALWENLTVRMDTSEVKGHVFHTRVKMSWPTLLANHTYENKSTIGFPLTQVGNVTYVNVTIRNPSSYLLLVQIVLDVMYPRFDTLWEGVPPPFVSEEDAPQKKEHGFFLAKNFGVMPLRLEPNEQLIVPIGFRALDGGRSVGHLVIRNNLTILELVPLSGRGVQPHFKFGNRRPGNQQPLLFEFSERHLKDCDSANVNNNNNNNKRTISLRRTFTAKNNGEIPIFINGYLINGLRCEGYGYRIINCEPVVLAPNGTKKIDIEFTPDFTLAKITRLLILETSLSFPVNYTLAATIPSGYLSLCAAALERPEWERTLYNVSVSLMLLALLIVILVALMDADRIIRDAVMTIARQNHVVQHTLDLRSIGAATRQELQTKIEAPESQHKASSDHVLKEDEKPAATVKADGEKYTAIVPTTGKSRKKNRKLCDMHDREIQKKLWMEAHRNKHDEQKDHQIKHVIGETSEGLACKKHSKSKNHLIKKQLEAKSIAENTPVSEEETSSTTTENSHIMDEHQQPEKKPAKKIQQAKVDNINMQVSEKENMQANCKSDQQRDKAINSKEKSGRFKGQDKVVEKVKLTKRERRDRDKTQAHNKKQPIISPTHSPQQFSQAQHPPPTSSSSSSPVPPRSVWNESRASFSDVVARTEIPISSTLTNASNSGSGIISKPTMYVEPYKQSNPQPQQQQPQQLSNSKLGPIGSRGLWSNMHSTSGNITDISDVNRSYSDMARESSNWFLEVDEWPDRYQHMNPWPAENNTHNELWNTSNEVYQRPSPVHNPRSTVTADIVPTTASVPTTSSMNYLWGSSVWEPWTPPLPRTPPGFAPQRIEDDDSNRDQHHTLHSQLTQNVNYNPFGYGNIWAQQTQPQSHTNPWQSQGQ